LSTLTTDERSGEVTAHRRDGAPSRRGRRTAGGGHASYVEAPPDFLATTVQACGLWPHTRGIGTPMVGVPVGHHLRTGLTVCCDPLSWFRAGLIHNPGMAVLGLTARGKSTLVRTMALGLAGTGARLLALGDLKPDYARLVTALGGQVVDLGRSRGSLNMLDAGSLWEASQRVTGSRAVSLRAEAIGRAADLTAALLEIYTRTRLPAEQETVLRAAIRLLLDDRPPGAPAPVLADLITVLVAAPESLRHLTLTAAKPTEAYLAEIAPLHRTLVGFAQSDFGAAFGRATTTALDLDATAVCVDISTMAAGRADDRLLAGVLLSTWAAGFAAIEAQHTLAEAGLARARDYLVIMDEIWAVLRSSSGMVERVDALTRTNRAEKVANVLITHSFKDFDSLPLPEDRAKARGFVERSGLVACCEMAQGDLDELDCALGLSAAEVAEVRSWSTGDAYDHRTGRAAPPSLGKFLLKSGGRPGIPVRVRVPSLALELNDTNSRWTQ
jgi:hypothetical protein